MKDSRIGELLWMEWESEVPDDVPADAVSFYTEGHIDIEHEVVRRALASAVQRSGVVDSLSQAYRALDSSTISTIFAGAVDGALDYTICDKDGMTQHEDLVEEVIPITMVSIYVQ